MGESIPASLPTNAADPVVKIDPRVVLLKKLSPPPPPPPPAVDDIVIDPFELVIIVTFVPAIKYEVPSVSLVRDPLSPEVCFVTPVNVVPLTVATIESLIAKETAPDVPPPVNPVPAVTAVISPTVPSFVIVIAPEDPVVIDMPLPAMRYEVPSVNVVKEPERPALCFVTPVKLYR